MNEYTLQLEHYQYGLVDAVSSGPPYYRVPLTDVLYAAEETELLIAYTDGWAAGMDLIWGKDDAEESETGQ